jgi:hypothetical protein
VPHFDSLRPGAKLSAMAKPKKPEHIQIKKIESTISVGKKSNKVHMTMTLSIKQEERFLEMLRKRKARRS